MKVLIACEFSGRVRDAFRYRGHDAVSCDILPSETKGPHLQTDVREVLDQDWDLMIAHPPCTHLSNSGARWFKGKEEKQKEAIDFVQTLLKAPIPKIALENPVGILSTRLRRPDQIIQPYQFGHGDSKATCLWLKDLPNLKPTVLMAMQSNRIHMTSQSATRWKERSRTYEGIASAMADQWGVLNG